MYSIQRILAAGALLVAMSPAAHALDLFTSASHMTNAGEFSCVIVNVGTKPIEVSAKVQSYWDGSDITTVTACGGSLAPGAGCAAISHGSGANGYCHFTTTSSRVRAALLVYNSNQEVTSTLPATK
jgi:hypothetical protein